MGHDFKYPLIVQLLFFSILGCSRMNAQPGRLITPYFEGVKYNNYVIKGRIIGIKEKTIRYEKYYSLHIVITNKLGQDIADSIWIEPSIDRDSYSLYKFYNLSYEYYFALMTEGRRFTYDPVCKYSILRINNGYVSTLFSSCDIFMENLYCTFSRWNDYKPRKMKIEKFEKKLKRTRTY